MNKLSKREKILLYILAIVVLLAGGWYVFIFPVFTQYEDAQQKIAEEKLIEQQMRICIQNADVIGKKIDAVNSSIDSISSVYYAPMTDNELDALVTGLLLRHNLTPQSLSMNFSEQNDLAPVGGIDAKTESETRVQSEIVKSSIAVEVKGQWNDFVTLAEEIRVNPSILIADFQIDDGFESGTSGSIFIDLEVMMYE